MKVGIIIVCRYDSTRLPGKILREIKAKPVITYIIERIKKVTNADMFVVATSQETSEEPIVEFCKKHQIKCFRGDKENVAIRMLNCAKDNKLDYFVRICGDNIFADYSLIDEMISIAKVKSANLVSNIKSRTFPKGISVEVVKTSFYEKMYSKFESEEDREHVTKYIYDNESQIDGIEYFFNEICPNASGIKLALDDKVDLEFITSIINKMSKPQDQYLLGDIYELSQQLVGSENG